MLFVRYLGTIKAGEFDQIFNKSKHNQMLKVLRERDILTSRTNYKFLLAYIKQGETERIWTDPEDN